MLKGHVAFAGRTFRPTAIDIGPYAIRTLSTNTAINRSLRKSHVSAPLKRRDWAADSGRSGRIKSHEHPPPWQRPGPPRNSGFPGSLYDYSRKPGGNRATRRANSFGSAIAESQQPRNGSTIGDLPKVSQDPRSRPPNTQESPVEKYTKDSHYADPVVRRFSRKRDGDYREDREDREGREDPVSIPYTTPASEFLYGTSVITAALQANKRKFYKLYMYDSENRDSHGQDDALRRSALQCGLAVQRVRGSWLRLMDKMSQGRPHNGYIMEASPLPRVPIRALGIPDRDKSAFAITLDHQSREDEAVNGTNTEIQYQSSFSRFPFVVLLDGILDAGNYGAILRSAHFLGADAVITCGHNAPLNSVALKASAGAAEMLPMMTVSQPIAFLDGCKANGWKVYAADAPQSLVGSRSRALTTSNFGTPLSRSPCILILGSEGEGLRWKIQRKADFEVGIEGQNMGAGGLDSLNVSVAGALLCEAFLRRPQTQADRNLLF